MQRNLSILFVFHVKNYLIDFSSWEHKTQTNLETKDKSKTVYLNEF